MDKTIEPVYDLGNKECNNCPLFVECREAHL